MPRPGRVVGRASWLSDHVLHREAPAAPRDTLTTTAYARNELSRMIEPAADTETQAQSAVSDLFLRPAEQRDCPRAACHRANLEGVAVEEACSTDEWMSFGGRLSCTMLLPPPLIDVSPSFGQQLS